MISDRIPKSVSTPTRRQMLALAPALAATIAPFSVKAAAVPLLDVAVRFAADRFSEAEHAFIAAQNEADALPPFEAMRACVGALSILPASSPEAIAAKRRVAGWHHTRGNWTLTLCDADKTAILDSIKRDEGML